MITENLSTLKIHKLSQAQYDRELADGRIDENALYLTPDEDIDLSGYATKDDLTSKVDTADFEEYRTKTSTAINSKVDSVNGKTGAVQLSAVDIGAAPDGYGLGTITPESITTTEQLDATRDSGFYRYYISGSNICGISFTYGSLVVYPIGTGGSVQELRPFSTNHCLRRNYLIDAWSNWELASGDYRTLLWENESLTSDFAAQTIALDLSFYDAVYVEAVRATDQNVISDAITVDVGGLSGFLVGHTEEFAVTRRRVTATTTGVKFLGFYSANTTNGVTNDIPYRIWGVKLCHKSPFLSHGGVVATG